MKDLDSDWELEWLRAGNTINVAQDNLNVLIMSVDLMHSPAGIREVVKAMDKEMLAIASAYQQLRKATLEIAGEQERQLGGM